MVIKFMGKENRKISILNNVILFLVVSSILFTYNISYALNIRVENNISIPTFSTKMPYENSRFKLLSLISFSKDDDSSTELAMDNQDYYEYYINKIQKKHTNLYEAALQSKKQAITEHIPDEFVYRQIDEPSLRQYLNLKGSILSEEPYFSAIINTAKDFNLNPLLLFAITGQEQSFVPKSNENAEKIANNPYNVFNSWKKYNTTIEDSSAIASRTVINLAKDRPNNIDLLMWINRKYSEDEDWHNGVRSIYDQLKTCAVFMNN